MKTVKSNDLKKGTRIQLKNGWYGTITDNARGNTRMAEIEGYYTEIGSIYATDIDTALVGLEWYEIEYTPAQLKLKKQMSAIFG
jgi:hypothetical protein